MNPPCPACFSSHTSPLFPIRDHSVSQESFEIWECADCSLRFTHPVPSLDKIGGYYRSGDYISHKEDAPGLINKIYRAVRKRTLRSKRKLVESLVKEDTGRNLLDIGAGTGAFAAEMKKNGWNVTALEPDENARKAARELYGLRLRPAEELFTLLPLHFNVITLWHVLEHVHDLHGYLDSMKKLLAPGGVIMVAVPNYTSKDAAIYREYWAAYDVPRHLYHFSPGSMKRLMEKHGMRVREMKPMWFDSFYVSMLSSKYRGGSTNYLTSFVNGLRSNWKAIGNTARCSSVIYVVEA
jgi:2-polyprenyl-3-methyl-5-hydroxy-6-metoxy-1,4-benzoquinol methylase